MRVSVKIQDKIDDAFIILLTKNRGGLTFDEIHMRLSRELFAYRRDNKELNRAFLRQLIGKWFKANKLETYVLDGQKIIKLKD